MALKGARQSLVLPMLHQRARGDDGVKDLFQIDLEHQVRPPEGHADHINRCEVRHVGDIREVTRRRAEEAIKDDLHRQVDLQEQEHLGALLRTHPPAVPVLACRLEIPLEREYQGH